MAAASLTWLNQRLDNRLLRRAVFVAVLLALMLGIGTAGFVFIEGYRPFDAFYMTLITITTVGYEEVHPLSHAGRVFNSFVILFGVSTIFIASGAMTQSIIELELQNRYGKRRKKKMIDNLHDHFIVCGFGRVGRNASAELQRLQAPVIVIDRREDRVERAMHLGMLALEADATLDDTLRAAGVMRAKGLIASLPSDAENLFIILSAKTLNPGLTVVTRASEEEAEIKLRRAGADIVFTPYAIVGHRIAQALVKPHLVEFLNIATSDVGPQVTLEQMELSPKSQLASKTFGEIQHRCSTGVIPLAVRRAGGQMVFNPPPETLVCAGDYLIAIGEKPGLDKLERLLAGS
jgi:voltage-gated potassium channel